MILENFPLNLGYLDTPNNPHGIPNALDFEVELVDNLLTQKKVASVQELLNTAYSSGTFLGTPLSHGDLGRQYALDFLAFLKSCSINSDSRILEIGSGTGYLAHLIAQDACSVIAVEPGNKETQYPHNKVQWINDFFPSHSIEGKFDLICAYGVLEHIAEPQYFIQELIQYLKPHGKIVFSVPDQSIEISLGDPSGLIHQHFNYFDANSIRSILVKSGLSSNVYNSNYGRCLYTISSLDRIGTDFKTVDNFRVASGISNSTYSSYLPRLEYYLSSMRAKILEFNEPAIWNPSRGIAYLDPCHQMTFFDDAPDQFKRYLPGFNRPINNFEIFSKSEARDVIVLSRTFAEKISSNLKTLNYKRNIHTIYSLERELGIS